MVSLETRQAVSAIQRTIEKEKREEAIKLQMLSPLEMAQYERVSKQGDKYGGKASIYEQLMERRYGNPEQRERCLEAWRIIDGLDKENPDMKVAMKALKMFA